MVYVEQVEGGLSRLMAVYATRLPESVGPVRSARESDLELLRQFDEPLLAFSGAQSKLLPLIDEAPLTPVDPTSEADAFDRDPGRAAPHNLFLRPDRVLEDPPGEAALTTAWIVFCMAVVLATVCRLKIAPVPARPNRVHTRAHSGTRPASASPRSHAAGTPSRAAALRRG